MSFFGELNRRNVLRVGAAYVVTAWLLIQVAETIFPLFGFDETPARITVVVLAIGLIPALVLAWAFEWTPEGLKRDADVDPSQRVAPDNARRLDRIIMAVLVLAVAYFGFDKFVLDPARDAEIAEIARQEGRADAIIEAFGDRSVAVLPFVNMSADPEQEYFSDGMAEELLNLLARIPELRVISRSSAFTYKGDNVPKIPTIARELGVNYIVEGSVRRAGDTIRITAQLIEGRTDRHLWADTYDRRLEDVFAIQDEISAAIVSELEKAMGSHVAVTPTVQSKTGAEAHEAYLRGQYLFARREIEGAVGAFEEAVGLDPNFAPAQAGLALAYRFVSLYLGGSKQEWIERALPHAQRALELNPDLPEAHAAMAYMLTTAETYDQKLEHLRTAIQLNPSYADAHLWLAQSLKVRGEFAEAFDLFHKALQLDPLSAAIRTNIVGGLLMQGRLAEAARENEKLKTLNASWYRLYQIDLVAADGNWAAGALAGLLAWSKEPGGQWELFQGLQGHLAAMGFPESAMPAANGEVFANTYRLLGQPNRIVEMHEGSSRNMDPSHYALALAGAGDYERAHPALEDLWQNLMNRSVAVPWFGEHHVIALHTTRIRAGGDGKSTDLIEALEHYVSKRAEAGIVGGSAFWDAHFEAGLLEWLKGHREGAISLIRRAVERGYFVYPNEAYLRELYDHPGFEEIMEAQHQRQARERSKFLAVICQENPYAELWRPDEVWCEKSP